MSGLRLGYSFHGFLADVKLDGHGNEISTPDGNATYSWSILWEAQRRGHTVYLMQEDRDWQSFLKFGKSLFSAFSQEKRKLAYQRCLRTSWSFGSEWNDYPELDVLLLEWRFPILGRNTSEMRGLPGYQSDLDRQHELLEHYSGTKTKVVIWDLDHKLELVDEANWLPDAIFETSVEPRDLCVKRTRVEPPFVIDDLLQHPTRPADPKKMLVYIGSRYERDNVIDEWIKPISDEIPGAVRFVGKWDADARRRWPNISFGERVGVAGFAREYGDAVAVPLLAKRSYMEVGFVTPRPWEAVLFGSLPIGFVGHRGIENYSSAVARNADDLFDLVQIYSSNGETIRKIDREEMAHRLQFMDVKNFVDKIEGVMG